MRLFIQVSLRMKRIFLPFLLFLISFPALAQNFVPVIASNVTDASGGPLRQGTICFQPVNAALQPTNFMAGGGGVVHSEPVCRAVNDGSMASLTLATSDHTSPVGIQYQVTVTDNIAGTRMGLGNVYVCLSATDFTHCQAGPSFDLDQWSPTNVTTLPFAGNSAITGSLTATGAITAPNFHGLADAAVTSQQWAALPAGCPNGYSPSLQDIHGNFLNCNANSYQASGTTPGMLAQSPAGTQMAVVPSGFFFNIGSASSYAQFDASGHLSQPIDATTAANAIAALGFTPLNKAGDQAAGLIQYPGSLLQATDPISADPSVAGFRAALFSLRQTSQLVRVAVIGDSISHGTGPTSSANTPINQLTSYLKQYGDGGFGFLPVGGGVGTDNNGAWQANPPTAPFPTTECSFGPSQIDPGASCSIWVTAPDHGLRLTGSNIGNTVRIEGVTDSTTSPITVTVDGQVLSTTVGGSTATPQVFSTTLTIPTPATQPVNHDMTLMPTNSDGIIKIYGAGFEASSGVVVDNYSRANLRSCAFGDTTSLDTYTAFLGLAQPAPSLAIIELGTNDSINTGGPYTASQYATCMANIVNKLRAINPQISLVFYDPENTSQSTLSNMTVDQMQTSEKTLAQQFGGKYVSIRDNWGTEANAAANGLMSTDGIHPTDKGGISSGSLLWDAIGHNLTASTASQTNTLTIPVNYRGTATSSGNTITYTSISGPFYFDLSGHVEVESCSDPSFDTTSATPLSVNGNVLTYTVSGTPGASASGCFLNTDHYILDASLLTGSNLYFVNNIDNLAQTGTLVNVKPGQSVTLTMICSDSVTNACLPSQWPSQFLYAAPTPITRGGRATQSITIDSNLAPNVITPNLPRAVTGALPATAIAAGACVTLTGQLPTALVDNGGYFLDPTKILFATPQANPGAGLDWSRVYIPTSSNPVVMQTTIDVDVCNVTAAPITPVSTVFNVAAF